LDGAQMLFDFNFQALGIEPDDCFSPAHDEEWPTIGARSC
jgi:hypothetical protein